MASRAYFVLCGLMWGAVSLWSSMLPFFSFSPYRGGENQWCIRYTTGGVEFSPVLWLHRLDFFYSPTGDASVDIGTYIWHWSAADFVFGDVTVNFRGVVWREERLGGELMMLGGIQLPTGVGEKAGVRRVENREVSYFPYTQRSLGWRVGFLGSYIALPVWFHFGGVYVSVYKEGASLSDFDVQDDYLVVQGSGDFFFRFGNWRFLVAGGMVGWWGWGSAFWQSSLRVWQRSTFFVGSMRWGYEVQAWDTLKMMVGFVQYNF